MTEAAGQSMHPLSAISRRGAALLLAGGLVFSGSPAMAQTVAPAMAAPAYQQGPLFGGAANPQNPQQTNQPYGQQSNQQPCQQNAATQPQQQQNANAQQQNNFDPVTGRRLTQADCAPQNRNDDRNQAPQPPSEFQQLVTASTGRNLPIFGSTLFTAAPSTFAPVDDIPVTPDYTLGPGDQLRLQVFGQVNLEATYIVDRNGSIFVPQVGSLHVAGLRYSQLTDYLRAQLGRVYRNFDLNVSMGQLRSITVFVLGQAAHPGSYTIGSLSTLLNALFASGGPTPQGSLRDIQVKRSGKTATDFDLYDLLLHGDKTNDIRLESGDVIFIPPAGPQVAIAGSVSTPAIYELHGETTLKQLVDLAGGYTNVASSTSARLERIYEHTERSILDLDLAASASTPLRNGDIVTIAPILARFKDAVTLRGNVANPGRYVWRDGMRLLDLIPNREALVTRNYYEKLNQLGSIATQGANPDKTGELGVKSGLSAATTTGGTGSTAAGAAAAAALADTSAPFPAVNDVVLPAPDIDWSYAVIERQSKTDLTTSLVSFAPGKLLLDGDQTQNLPLLPGDVVTIFSKADIRVPTSQQTRFVKLEGEFAAPGSYSVLPGETLRQLLHRVGGFTPDAYLYASQFTRESTRRLEAQRLQDYADALDAQITSAAAREANSVTGAGVDTTASTADARLAVARLRRIQPLGRLVLTLKPDSRFIDDVPDLALEDGDRFIVPGTPSSVTVQGQVYNANAFLFERGKRASGYLRQAGGPDRLADKKRMFIVRADGSVYSQQYGNIPHSNIFPGDTIVLPPVLSHSNLLRNIISAASIAAGVGSNLALLVYLTR